MKKIKFILDNGLCVGCGACFATCMSSAIRMERTSKGNTPVIDEKKCTDCNKCSRACPVLNIVSDMKKNKSLMGEVKSIYVGHSTDSKIRKDSSSGGIVTAISLFLLKKRMVDGVICGIKSKSNPLENDEIIAYSRDEIMDAKGSKYSPLSPCVKIKDVINKKGKFLFVGKGCDIRALERLKIIYPTLEKKIFLTIGIFCSHEPTIGATVFLLKEYKINISEVKGISYRGNGWPGYLSINLKYGKKVKIPYQTAWSKFLANREFMLPACEFCIDGLADLADISVGDPWSILGSTNTNQGGESLVVVHTNEAKKLLKIMYADKIIEIEETTKKTLSDSQKSIVNKRKKVLVYLHGLRIIKKIFPYLFPRKSSCEREWRVLIFFSNCNGMLRKLKKCFKGSKNDRPQN